jgi:hypothetical protein
MMPFNRIPAYLFFVALLSGCASPAEVKNMVVDQRLLVNAEANTPFKNALSIRRVNGGEDTNPLWTSEVSNSGFRGALRGSLEQSGLLAPTSGDTKYDLHATLSKLDQPLFGLDFKVISSVNYRVVERGTRKTWFDEPVTAAYTATFGDAAIAIQRLRLANEGSIRENIKQFIARLITVFKPPE